VKISPGLLVGIGDHRHNRGDITHTHCVPVTRPPMTSVAAQIVITARQARGRVGAQPDDRLPCGGGGEAREQQA